MTTDAFAAKMSPAAQAMKQVFDLATAGQKHETTSMGRMREKEVRLPVSFLHECFTLRDDGALIWKRRPREHFTTDGYYRRQKRAVGTVAGALTKKGYLNVDVTYMGEDFQLRAHRIVWALVTGAWPMNTIDHRNRVKSDNRPSNLRDVTLDENLRNNGNRSGRGRGNAHGTGFTRAHHGEHDRGLHPPQGGQEGEADPMICGTPALFCGSFATVFVANYLGWVLVGRTRFELVTNGLKARCARYANSGFPLCAVRMDRLKVSFSPDLRQILPTFLLTSLSTVWTISLVNVLAYSDNRSEAHPSCALARKGSSAWKSLHASTENAAGMGLLRSLAADGRRRSGIKAPAGTRSVMGFGVMESPVRCGSQSRRRIPRQGGCRSTLLCALRPWLREADAAGPLNRVGLLHP